MKIIQRKKQAELALEHLPELLQRIYANRGIRSGQSLERSLRAMLPYDELKGMSQAVKRLQQALATQERILVVGDFDADGATSVTIALRGLRAMGAKSVDFLVPNRFDFGYGLTPELVDYAYPEYKPDLIVTVDNGIASLAGVAKANDYQIDVIVTDHHLAGETLPDAVAIVNPNQPGCPFPSKNLAGVGVMFYTLIALRATLRQVNWFVEQNIDEPNLADYLDIVALGTVADVVPLDQNNRILVYQGLERIRRGQACAGINALIQVSRPRRETIAASDLGFAIGPRLNAAGRLEDMSLGIHCLLSTDSGQALALATELDRLNLERRGIEDEMKSQAFAFLKALSFDKTQLPAGLCLYEEEWHQGVVGLLAARVREQIHRPVICFAKANEDEIKGSARSIPGCHIRDVLAVVASQQPELLSKFGGHAMAAGLSLRRQDLKAFATAFAGAVEAVVDEEMLTQKVYSDGQLAPTELSLSMATVLREAGPWGQAFPEPLFDDTFEVLTQRLVGEKHLKLTLKKAGQKIEAIAFNQAVIEQQSQPLQVHLVYRLSVNEFRGQQSVQLIVEHLEPVYQVELA